MIRLPIPAALDTVRLEEELVVAGIAATAFIEGNELCIAADENLQAQVQAVLDEHTGPLPRALHPAGVIATLNAVLGVWPLADAANAAGVSEQALIDEATAWALA